MPTLAQALDRAYRHLQAGNLPQAEELYRQILHIDPHHFDAWHLLGLIAGKMGALDLAAEYISQALRLNPEVAEAHYNFGLIRRRQNKLADAVAGYREAIRLKPDYVEAHCNLGLLWLLQGNYEQGWPEFEWRRQKLNFRSFPQPDWNGEAFPGKRLLLHSEQGLGDTMQFVRFLPLVKKLGGTVFLECRAELSRLLSGRAGIDQVVTFGDPLPDFDVQLPLMSLPALLKTTLTTVPASIPYLAADAALTRSWQQEFAQFAGFKIGIAWQGDPRLYQPSFIAEDRERSILLEHFEPLARQPGVRLFSLQKGHGSEQLAPWGPRWGMVDLSERLHDFMDTAAVMMNLDLIVSADTAPVHLAGALGRQAWTALPYDASWRWLIARENSPWYPTMRLFRQKAPGAWAEVFERMAGELERPTQEAVHTHGN